MASSRTPYQIEIVRSAEKTLLRIPKENTLKIVEAIQALAFDPYPAGCRKLEGGSGAYRIRVGTYRIIYEVHHAIITIRVLKIGHRKDVYR